MKLATRSVEKVWGRQDLPAPFHNDGEEPIGEIWFEPTSQLDRVLIKYLFTSEKLSVQVHPADGQAGPGKAGKEECWLVLDAQPEAALAIGFHKALTPEELRAAALDGSIEDLLVWHPVRQGDFFFLPAGTVHAIGPGLTLVEVQQNTDITYRLFDYGRPRELHLDQAITVAQAEPYPERLKQRIASHESRTLVKGPHFRLSQVVGKPGEEIAALHPGPLLVLPLEAPTMVAGEQVDVGECALANALGEVALNPSDRVLLVSQA